MSEQSERPVILVVDDEPLITDLLRSALDDAGFSSVEASDADEAFAILERDGAGLAGLVTDINLGAARSGWDIARRAREQNAAVAIVYCSGGNPQDWPVEGVPKSVMLTKPFAPAQVVVALSNLINGALSGA